MRRSVSRMLLILLVALFLLSTISFAANEASLYLSGYLAYITKSGNTININYEVLGTRTMDKIGVTEIYLYEKSTGSSTWTLVATYLSTDPTYTSAMIGTNTGLKMDSVSYSGTSSYQYKAYVTVYAEKDGGSDSRNIVAS